MAHYHVPLVGAGHNGDPHRPYGLADVDADPESYRLHYVRTQYAVVAADGELAVYEELAEDPDSGVERVDEADAEQYPAPDVPDDEGGETDADDGESGSFECEVCGDTFGSQAGLNGHMGSH